MKTKKVILRPSMLHALVGQNSDIYVSDEFVFFRDMRSVVRNPMLEMVRTPQYVEIGRVLRVSDGTATFRINLLPFQLRAGDILVIPENTYIEITDMSDDFNAQTVSHQHLSVGFPRCTQLHLSDNDFARIGRYLDLIWEVVHQDAFSPVTVEHLLSAMMEDLKRLRKQVVPRFSSHQTHGEQIMQHFLDLVAAHGATERKVAFYAEQLRLTPNHLSSVIRQQSGQTVMQWLNERTILQAKVLLRGGIDPIGDIAFALGFDEQGSFARFFKRETGMTPTEYRNR